MGKAFDEIMGRDGAVRPELAAIGRWLEETPPEELKRRQDTAEVAWSTIGAALCGLPP